MQGQAVATVAEKIHTAFCENAATNTMEVEKILPTGLFAMAFKANVLGQELHRMYRDPYLGAIRPLRERVVIDFSSPNVAKELHVGHLRSTIIGDVLARIQEFLGHDVLRLNHVGDWGTQFGMLITYLRDEKVDTTTLDLPQLMTLYQEARKKFDGDLDFKTRSRSAVAELQGGGEDALRIWSQICQVSRAAFQKIYDDLDITIIERGESYYNPLLTPVVDYLLEKKIAVIKDGAVCVFSEGYEAPFMIRKSDGGFSYDTTDLAALKHRIEVEKAKRVIYVVDAGQAQHFDQLRDVATRAGILDPEQVNYVHCGFGVVQGPDGKKYKTRSGDVALLKDLVDEAVARAKALLEEHGINDEKEAKKLGAAALRYADLKNSREKNYQFDADRLLEMKGNTAAYLLYAVARIHAIKEKAKKALPLDHETTASSSPTSESAKAVASDYPAAAGAGVKASEAVDISEEIHFDFTGVEFNLTHPKEKNLAAQIVRFADVIAKVDETLEPHHLCEFLFRVGEEFSAFYDSCAVIDGGKLNLSRLMLCDMVDKVLRRGLSLLGITPLKRM